MIEADLRKYLEDYLGVPVYLQIPDLDQRGQFVYLEKTGGGEENQLPRSTFAIQSWADSQYEASFLNERVKEVMRVLPDTEHWIARAKLNSDYYFPDLRSRKFRYQAVYDLNHY